MPSEWNIRYERWVINDCEPDRAIGESFDSTGVEFLADNALVASNESREIAAIPVGDFQYRVTALVTYVSEKTAVIDFGVKAVGPRALLPSECAVGDYIVGDIGISLTPFIEVLPKDILQSLEVSWHVNRIFADLTPYISHSDDATGTFRIRDVSRIHYKAVSSTDSIITHSYVLHCSQEAAASREK